MKQKITILVNSCDKYEDAWFPFFECLWHFAGDLPYPIILNTETKQFVSPHYNVKVVNNPNKVSWSVRLLTVLDQINTEYVLFLLDDYFLQEPFDSERLSNVISYMDKNAKVGFVDIKPRWASSKEEYEENKAKYSRAQDEFVVRQNKQFNITCAPGVWRTSVLKSLLRPHEDIWSFEKYVGIRARAHNVVVVRFLTRFPAIYEYEDQIWGTKGITAGKWLPGNLPFFDQLGIEINYEKLGIINAETIQEIAKKNRRSVSYLWKHGKRRLSEWINRYKSLK